MASPAVRVLADLLLCPPTFPLHWLHDGNWKAAAGTLPSGHGEWEEAVVDVLTKACTSHSAAGRAGRGLQTTPGLPCPPAAVCGHRKYIFPGIFLEPRFGWFVPILATRATFPAASEASSKVGRPARPGRQSLSRWCIRELNSVLCDNLEGWDGVGGRFRREGTHVCSWLIHAAVQQKTAQHCKAIILQFKKEPTCSMLVH